MDLPFRPRSLRPALVQTDEAPARVFDKDRRQQQRLDILPGQHLLFLWGEVSQLADDDFAPLEHDSPVGETAFKARQVLQAGVVDLLTYTRRHPLEALTGYGLAVTILMKGE